MPCRSADWEEKDDEKMNLQEALVEEPGKEIGLNRSIPEPMH